ELQFQLGATAYQTRSYTSALEHFLASNRLVPNRNVVYNIARSFEQLGRDAEAYRYYVDAKVGAPKADIKDIDEALERLAPRVAVIDVPTVPDGPTIFVQRKDLGSVGQTPRPLAVEPGDYIIMVELDGYKPAQSESIKLKKGGKSQVR